MSEGAPGRAPGSGPGASGDDADASRADDADASRGDDADAIVIELPGPLRDLNGGRPTVALPPDSATVGEALARLREDLPAVHDRLVTERGEVRTHVNLFVEGAEIRHTGGLDTPIAPGARILVVPAVSGG